MLLVALSVLATTLAPPAPAQRLGPNRNTPASLVPPRVPITGPRPTWSRRAPHGDQPTTPNLQGLTDLGRWPAEPQAPAHVDPVRFAQAFAALCPRAYRPAAPRLAAYILTWSAHFEVDPFTVGALSYYRSNCRVRFRQNRRLGLGAIDPKMHAAHIRKRRYQYATRHGDAFRAQTLDLSRFPFYPASLRRAEPNIYFTAALLQIYQAQCPDLDESVGSVRHRAPVSHLFWGDRVLGTDSEDRILLARRRLLSSYRPTRAETTTWGAITIQRPLGGGLRKLTSKMGDERDGGRRRHKGVDFASDRGEPVFAIADGRVTVAGPQTTHGGLIADISSSAARRLPKEQLIGGGLLVMLQHSPHQKSAYMHLDGYAVRRGQTVKRGALIGWVGRTGVREAHAHLHFELRIDDRSIDPMPVFGDLLISPLATWRGLRLDRRLRAKRQTRRKARQRARRQARGRP